MTMILKRLELSIRSIYLRQSKRPFKGELITSPQNIVAASSPRILLLRQDRLGDVLCSTPVLDALRRHFPYARIDMLLSRNNIQLAGVISHWCHHIWCYEKSFASFIHLRRQLRRQRYDVVIDLMDNPSATSTMFLRTLATPIRIGIAKENAWVYTHCVPLLDRSQYHYVERIAQLLLPFGIDPRTISLDLHFPLTKDQLAQAAGALDLIHHPERNGFILIHLSSRHTTYQWGWKNYAALINKLLQQYPSLAVGLGASKEHHAIARQLAQETGAFALPVLPFDQYAALLRYAKLLISPDTSIIHVAAALKVPAVVLYHQHDPALLPWYPYRSPYRALIARKTGTIAVIPPEAVLTAASELLSDKYAPYGERIFAAA